MRNRKIPPLAILLVITIINYLVQIPYYLILYYFPYHILPSTTGMILLGITLLWFIIGYRGMQKKCKYGYGTLLSFLIVESLFYLHTIVFGAFLFQLQHPNIIIKLVFLVGYISGITALYYAWALIRYRQDYIRRDEVGSDK